MAQKFQLKLSFVDLNATNHSSAKIMASEVYGNVIVGQRTVLHKSIISGNVIIGRNTTLWGPNIQVLSENASITIGNFCFIARDVTIQEYFHDYERITTYYIGRNVFGKSVKEEVISKGPIYIGSDVWIGTGSQIMSGVNIGNGAVIAANAVVTKDIPPYAIVAGCPAKIIKYRFNAEEIIRLLAMQWWDWDIEKIGQHPNLFNQKHQIT